MRLPIAGSLRGLAYENLKKLSTIASHEILMEWGKYARKASPHITGKTYPTIFWRTLVADGGTRGKDSDYTRQQLYEAVQNLVERNMGGSDSHNWKPLAETSVVNRRCMEFGRFMDVTCVGRITAFTGNGFLGLVPSDAQIGDEIVILETVRAPLVLRCVPPSADYFLIGECYIQGWVDGERFNGSSAADLQFLIV